MGRHARQEGYIDTATHIVKKPENPVTKVGSFFEHYNLETGKKERRKDYSELNDYPAALEAKVGKKKASNK